MPCRLLCVALLFALGTWAATGRSEEDDAQDDVPRPPIRLPRRATQWRHLVAQSMVTASGR